MVKRVRNPESLLTETALAALETVSALWDTEPNRVLSLSLAELAEEMREIGLDVEGPDSPDVAAGTVG